MRYTLFILVFFYGLTTYAQEDQEGIISTEITGDINAIDVARERGAMAVEHLKNENFAELSKLFSGKMKETLTDEKMEQVFSSVRSQYGKIIKALEFSEKVTAEAIYYQQGIEFKKEKFNLNFSLNRDFLFNSFRLVPYTPNYTWSAPSYAKEELYDENGQTVGTEMPLTAKITVPKIENTQTIVVLVHGSGPNDMDESLGPNKIFKDLAYGFASNGIACLRYNKRSYDYPSAIAKNMNSITIDEIVVNDAVAAVKKARSLGAEKVVLIGHSLGGYLAPKIAALVELDGVIIMAGNSSPLEDVLVSQYEHLMKNDPESSIGEFQVNMIKTQVKNVQDGNYTETTPAMMFPLGLPASFWLSLKDYNAVEVSKKQAKPYLILNGKRDYQVTPEEAKRWKNGNKNPKSETIIYPGMNHLFYKGTGVLLPSEYDKEDHLDEAVLMDMVNWIKAL